MKILTYLFKSFWSSSATGLRVNLSFFLPSGRPKCEQRTTDLQPFSKAYLIEGMAAAILALLVIAPEDLSWGTLKSHLNVSTRVKTRENVVVLDFKAVDNFDFTGKNVKINLG